MKNSSVKIEDFSEVKNLVGQLSSTARPLTRGALGKALKSPAIHILCLREKNKVVAIGTVVLMHTILGIRARIEDVVVDEAHRGKGLGEKLSHMLIARAKKLGCGEIELSSRPSRIAANNLYKKLGFEQKETNVYRMKLNK